MESLSIQMQPFFQWLLRTTLQASLLICLILFFQTVLRSRLGARWHNCLWLLLLIRLAIPWAPQSRLSIFNLIPQSITQQQTEYSRQEIMDDTTVSEPKSPSTTESKPASTTTVQQDSPKAITTAAQTHKETKGRSRPVFSRFAEIQPLIWLSGALVLAVYVTAGNFRLWRLVTRERPLTDQSFLDLLEDCKSEMGIRTILGVVITDRVKSPALFGFVRPRLLLPAGIIENLSLKELRHVFLHELAHLKRHDIYIGYLASLLQVLHWFNPLIWLAFYRIRTDRELACDALVLAQTHSSESKDYGRTIVSLLERFSLSQRLPAMAGILETKAQLKRRITMIAKFKKNSYQLSPLAVILIIILACISLPNARGIKASGIPASKPSHQPKFTKIRIPTEISWDMHLSPDGQKVSLVSDKKLWIMPLAGQLGPDIPGAPVELETKNVRVEWTAHTWSGDGKWIAFNEYPVNERNEENKGNQGIYIVSTEGGNPKKVHENYRDERTVNYRISLSPRGKTLAFSSVDLERKEQNIYTIPIEGGSPKKLVDAQAREPVFSPDGKMIAFVEDKDLGRGGGALWVVPAQGGIPKHVVDAENASSPIWSPNGDMIAFLDRGKKRNKINFIPIGENGEAAGELITIDAPEGIDGIWLLAGWSPDNRIGAVFERRGESGLYIVPTKGGKAMQVARGGGQPRWSPDGERIFIVARARRGSGTWQRLGIASIRAEGGSIKTVPIQSELKMYIPYFGVGNRVSPDGKIIVFSGKTQYDPVNFLHNHIWTLPVNGGVPEQLTEAPKQSTDMFPCWSPDGKTIAFVRARIPEKIGEINDYNTNIYNVQADGGEPTSLTTESDSVSFGPIEWSPDGKFVAYFSQEDSTSSSGNLKIISVNGDGNSRIIGKVRDPHPGMQFAWSPDSKQIAFDGPDGKVIKIISIEDGNIVKIETGLVDTNIGDRLDWSPDGERFVFVGGKGESKEFWVMENFLPETLVAKAEPMTTVRRIGGDWGTFASLSPDGKYMCDVDWDTERLAVLELATGKIRHISSKSPDEAYPLDSAISPDSKEAAYLWWDPNTKASSLHIAGLDGSGHRLLCKGKYPMPREWSSDGKKIFTIISENDVQQMVWVSVSDGSIQPIASFNGESLGYPGKFDISPDGRFIAYDRPQDKDTSNRDIFVFDLSENREVSLVKHPANDKLLGWTPDGKHVLFASNRTESWDAWLLQITDGRVQGFPELAKHGIGDVRPIGFTPQGSYYYGHEQILNDVFMARLDLETGELLSEPVPIRQTGATTCHDWSPDGLYLAYCQRRGDRSQAIHIRTLATGRERTLATSIPYIRWLRWTPDMRFFLIDGYKRGDSQGVISKIDVKTGERSDIIQSTTEVLIRPEMSPDGKTLFYDRINPKSRTMRLVGRDMESGREKELFRIVAPTRLTGSALSPDGQRIVLSIVPSQTGPEGPVLKTLSTAGGQPRELLQFKKSEKLRAVGVTWMPDSKNVLFWKWFQGDKELELWRISAEGGEPRKLCSRKTFGHIRVHPDGQRIAFSDRSTTRGVWVMENFLPRVVSKAKQSR